MKKIQSCQLGDLVRPIMDGWYCDGGHLPMYQDQEYAVHKFHPDKDGRLNGPHSYVKLRDGRGVEYCLNYDRLVLGRIEANPTLPQLLEMPQEVWVNSRGEYDEDSINRTQLKRLCEKAKGTGEMRKTHRTRTGVNGRTTVHFDESKMGELRGMTRQGLAILGIIMDSGKTSMPEPELELLLRENADRIRSTKDCWKVFMDNKYSFKSQGVLRFEEPPPDQGSHV